MHTYKQQNERLRGAGGFTLIEVLVTTVVIALGCLGALHLQSVSMQAGSTADERTVAAFLAETKLETMRAVRFTDLKIGSSTQVCTRDGACCDKTESTPCTGSGHPSYPYEIVTKVIEGEPTTLSRRIEIQISWNDVYGPRSIQYDAALTNFSF
ncbi:MAG: prepilin-type N-terminal cleavage/methylation domain-containing protein [Candidatus Adiutrix sp.]|jgi:type IV pilus assembly protein PilV|nr:prepilin-type N-terminal cleavage/methylation domain-containing protein [Candidatus Adiutrix sp.]